jgi:hypothetical protein
MTTLLALILFVIIVCCPLLRRLVGLATIIVIAFLLYTLGV